MIVFRVTHRNGIPRGQSECVQGDVQAGGLADALRQDHDLSSVEQQHQRLFQRADNVQQARCIDGCTVHETLARHHLDTTCSHLGEKHV